MTAPTGLTAPSTAVATTTPPRNGVVALLESESARAQIEPFLPEGTDLQRVAASALMAVKTNPDLSKCTPISLVLAVAKIAQWGLEIGTTAYLVPFFNSKKNLHECVAIAGAYGLCELMVGSGAVMHVEPHAVFQADQFSYSLGLAPELVHRRSSFKDRGPVVAAYVILHFRGGRKVFDVMTVEEVDAIRLKFSKQWKQGPCPDWYAAKTVVRRISKTVPKNPRLAKVLAIIADDERAEFGQEVASVEAPAAATLLTAGEAIGTPDAAPDLPVCCACYEVRVEGEGMMCAGCEEESRRLQAEGQEGGELPLGDAKPRRSRDALRQG